MMTPDRGTCWGVISRHDPLNKHEQQGRPTQGVALRCGMRCSLIERRQGIAEILVDCGWRGAGVGGAVLGGVDDFEPCGGPVSLRDADCESDGVRDYRVHTDFSGQACGSRSSMAVFDSDWIYWGI